MSLITPNRRSARAWILLCLALALHVFDEATTGFLGVYNPTVLALRERFGWWPMPTFEFREWLAGLIVACVVLLALSGRGAKGTRIAAYIFAVLMLFNAAGHTLGTIFGQTVASVTFRGQPRDSGRRQSWRLQRSICCSSFADHGKNARQPLESGRIANRPLAVVCDAPRNCAWLSGFLTCRLEFSIGFCSYNLYRN
jgi:hypothetical protein